MHPYDDLDRRLIALLREDGRAPVSKLATLLKVSRATVQSRMDRLVPIAEFAHPQTADDAWSRLEDAGIPASVVTDKALLGSPEVTRLYVETPNVEAAQALIADLV